MTTTTRGSRLHPEHTGVFAALEAAAIPWCLVRPEQTLDASAQQGGDLDLLVEKRSGTAVQALLEERGYRVARTEYHNPGKLVLVKWTGDRVITLDIHLECVINGLVYLDAPAALQRRVQQDGLWFLDAADMYAVILVHDLVGKRCLQDKYHDALRQLIEPFGSTAGEPTRAELNKAGLGDLVPATADQLEPLLADADLAARRGTALERALATRSLGTRARRLWMGVRRAIRRPQRGACVALAGPDGSGKTTTAHEMAKLVVLGLRAKAPIQYLGPWGHDHLKLTTRLRADVPHTIRQLLQARRKSLASTDIRPSLLQALALEWKRRHGQMTDNDHVVRHLHRSATWSWMAFRWVRGHLRYWVFLAILWVELWVRYLALWRAKRWGAVVICDRYVFDLLSGAMHGITRRYHFARALFVALYPKPDVTVLLHEEAEVLVERKTDLDLETMREMQALYESMARRWGFVPVRADVPPPEVAKRAFGAAFDRIVAKRRT